MPAALKVTAGYLRGRVLPLPARQPFVIGRALDTNLTLYGPGVEERHATLVPDGDGHRLVPKAPLRVRGEPASTARALKEGDAISIGKHELVYARAAPAPIGADLAPDTPCASCASPVASSGPTSLEALRVADEVFCPRCVDRRLHAARSLDRYRVLRKIGANEDEITYLAQDRDDPETRVSLRILKADKQVDLRYVRRFLARALVGLVVIHPRFLATHAILATHGILHVVLDFHDGKKLERLVREKGPRSPGLALDVAQQLAIVLRHARMKRIIVAKRKRSGVIIDREGQVKVGAFDLVRELEDTAVATLAFADVAARCGLDPDALRAAGPIAPRSEEQARLSRLAPESAEAYGAARILYQLVTGRSFQGSAPLNELRAAAARIAPGRSPLPAPPAGSKTRDVTTLPFEVVRLLDRVLVPLGPERISTLDGFERGCREARIGLAAAEVGTPAELEVSDIDDVGDESA